MHALVGLSSSKRDSFCVCSTTPFFTQSHVFRMEKKIAVSLFRLFPVSKTCVTHSNTFASSINLCFTVLSARFNESTQILYFSLRVRNEREAGTQDCDAIMRNIIFSLIAIAHGEKSRISFLVFFQRVLFSRESKNNVTSERREDRNETKGKER